MYVCVYIYIYIYIYHGSVAPAQADARSLIGVFVGRGTANFQTKNL